MYRKRLKVDEQHEQKGTEQSNRWLPLTGRQARRVNTVFVVVMTSNSCMFSCCVIYLAEMNTKTDVTNSSYVVDTKYTVYIFWRN